MGFRNSAYRRVLLKNGGLEMHKVEDHLPLVRKIATSYSKSTRVDFDDLYQEGCIGLMRACREYKEGAVPFGAFAAQRIRYAILALLKKSNPIHISSSIVDNAIKIRNLKLEDESIEVIAEKMMISNLAAKRAIEHLNREVLSLDFKYADKSGKERLLIDCVHIDSVDFETSVLLEQLIADLSPKETFIVTKFYEGYDYEIISQQLGLTKKSVRTYLSGIRKKLREKRELISS